MRVEQSSFSTASASTDAQIDAWNDYCREQIAAVRVRPLGTDDISMRARTTRFPLFDLIEMTGSGFVSERTLELTQTHPAHGMILAVLIRGNSFVYHSTNINVMAPGDASLSDVGAPSAHGGADGFHEAIICFRRDTFTDRYGDTETSEPLILHTADRERVTQRAENLVRRARSNLRDDSAAASSLAAATFELVDDIVGRSGRSAASHWITAIEYIRRSIHDPGLSVGEVAALVGISERQLARVFASHGTTVARVITEERMRTARDRLTNPELRSRPIAEIARELGFLSPSQFARTFRRTYGTSAQNVRAERQSSVAHGACGDERPRDDALTVH